MIMKSERKVEASGKSLKLQHTGTYQAGRLYCIYPFDFTRIL
jgi:hypothetical protein